MQGKAKAFSFLLFLSMLPSPAVVWPNQTQPAVSSQSEKHF